MSYLVSNLKTDLQGVIRGTNLNKVQGVYELISRGARQLLGDADLQEMKRYAQLANPIYDSIYDYVIPTDVNGNRIFDIRPLGDRQYYQRFYQAYNRDFDQNKLVYDRSRFTVQFNGGVRTIRIDLDSFTPHVIHTMDNNEDNGVWVVGGQAANIEVDQLQKLSGDGSLRFDLTGTSGYIENLTLDAVDLTDLSLDTSFFVPVYLPASGLTSVELRIGSSNTNYYSLTATSGHLGAFTTGWNLLRFDWESMAVTGTPDDSALDYLRLTFVTTGALSNVRVDSITNNRGAIYEMGYYSKFMFTDSVTGAWKERAEDDDDIINLDVESYNLLLDICAVFAFQQIHDQGSSDDIALWQKQYKDDLANYKSKYKSEAIPPQQSYYNMRRSAAVKNIIFRG